MNTTENGPAPLAWAEGRILPASQATVPLMDDGFLRGDAVFEAVYVHRGRTHALEPHLARMRRSAKAMDIDLPPLKGTVADLLAAWGERDGALKLVVTRGGTVRGIVYRPTWPPSLALHVVDIPWRSALSGVKTLSYATNQWALRQAEAAHADDALVVTDGRLMELPTGSLCLVEDGAVRTPDPAVLPILDSVTVDVLAEVTTVDREVLDLDDLTEADEVFVVSATRPVLPVHAIDDRSLPAPGDDTARLREALREHIASTFDPLP